jgi:hypothetical protein
VSIFVPRVLNGVLYNDVLYARPLSYEYFDPVTRTFSEREDPAHYIKLVKELATLDVAQRNSAGVCALGELLIPANTMDWMLVDYHTGESNAFNRGLLDLLFAGLALGIGFEQGLAPVEISLDPSVSNEMAIAFALWFNQTPPERDNLDLLGVWNEASARRDVFNAGLAAISGLLQGVAGAQAYSFRHFAVLVQENVKVRGLYRAIIQTRHSAQDAWSGEVFTFVKFVSYQASGWNEDLFFVVRGDSSGHFVDTD